MTWSASRRTPYSNANVRTALRFRYDPASEVGPDPHPQSDARTGTHGRLGLSVLFFVFLPLHKTKRTALAVRAYPFERRSAGEGRALLQIQDRTRNVTPVPPSRWNMVSALKPR